MLVCRNFLYTAFITLFFFLSLISVESCESQYILRLELANEQNIAKSHDEILFELCSEWLDTLCCKHFQGRKVGTEGNRLAHDFLWKEIGNIGYTPQGQEFETENGTRVRNIIVEIPGKIDSTIIIGAHFDGAVQSSSNNHYQAAEDNGSGTVTLLMILKSLSLEHKETERSIVCCFWDSEESFDGRPFRGSTYYANGMSEREKGLTLFYQNLDTIGHDHDGNNEIYLEYLGNKRVEQLTEVLSENERFIYHISARYNNMASDYYSFYSVGIPFISYHDHSGFVCEHPNHTLDDTKGAISIERLVKIVHNTREAIEIY